MTVALFLTQMITAPKGRTVSGNSAKSMMSLRGISILWERSSRLGNKVRWSSVAEAPMYPRKLMESAAPAGINLASRGFSGTLGRFASAIPILLG
jgi:hypothetical protein